MLEITDAEVMIGDEGFIQRSGVAKMKIESLYGAEVRVVIY